MKFIHSLGCGKIWSWNWIRTLLHGNFHKLKRFLVMVSRRFEFSSNLLASEMRSFRSLGLFGMGDGINKVIPWIGISHGISYPTIYME